MLVDCCLCKLDLFISFQRDQGISKIISFGDYISNGNQKYFTGNGTALNVFYLSMEDERIQIPKETSVKGHCSPCAILNGYLNAN